MFGVCSMLITDKPFSWDSAKMKLQRQSCTALLKDVVIWRVMAFKELP